MAIKMVSQEVLQKYAALAVRVGVNVQKGQLLIISADVDCAFFARLCAEEAYRAGAGEVVINWSDETSTKLAYRHQSTETLCNVAQWRVEQRKNWIDRKCCFLYIESATPGLMAEIDGNKLQAARVAREAAFEPFEFYTMANFGQWSIVAIPTAGWAAKVFPGDEKDAALEKLWNAVLMSVRVRGDNDPVEEWRRHNGDLTRRSERMNQLNFHSLHFQNALGTDLTVELVRGHVWEGGCSTAKSGVVFNPNMPTEEVFTMPAMSGVNGRVYATMPLSYQGKMIENFHLDFEDGKVVRFAAEKGEETLKSLIEFDEGSSRLGEVALIPYDSPIRNSGVLFLNTLFDENASCHLALGASYPDNLKNGAELTREERTGLGANYSKIHCDFMFGSADMKITGTTQEGKLVPVFENGNFVL